MTLLTTSNFTGKRKGEKRASRALRAVRTLSMYPGQFVETALAFNHYPDKESAYFQTPDQQNPDHTFYQADNKDSTY